MIDENLIYQLFDTQSPMAHGVSPKTGLFNTYIPIASLVGSNGLGPTLDINLFYSPDMRDLTFKNWALRFTHYFMTPLDKQFENVESRNTLYMATGEAWKNKKPDEKGTHVTPSFIAEIPEHLGKYINITRKDGVKEVLVRTGADIFVPGVGDQAVFYYILEKLISPSGHELSLKWGRKEYRKAIGNYEKDYAIPRLESVSDETGELLTVEYLPDLVRFNIYPKTSKKYTYSFTIKGDELTSSQTDNAIDTKKYTYTTPIPGTSFEDELSNLTKKLVNRQIDGKEHEHELFKLVKTLGNGPTRKLKTIESARGLVETLTYQENTDYIDRYTTTSSSGKVKHSDIEYGYEEIKNGFYVSSTDSISGAITEHYFDSDVRLTTQIASIGDSVETTKYEFSPGKNQVTFTTIKTIKNGKNSRSDKTIDVLDFFGNQISKTVNGITKEWTYYHGKPSETKIISSDVFSVTSGVLGKLGWVLDYTPQGLVNQLISKNGYVWGTVEKYYHHYTIKNTYNLPVDIICPEDFNKLRVYVESEKVYSLNKGSPNLLSATYFGYKIVPQTSNAGKGYHNKPSTKLTVHNPVTDESNKLILAQCGAMVLENTTYDENTKSKSLGHIIASTQSMLDKNGKEIKGSLLSTKLSYVFSNDETLTEYKTVTSDTITVTHQEYTHPRTGTLLKTVNNQGDITDYKYDTLGRLTQKTELANDIRFKSTSTIEYITNPDNKTTENAVQHTSSAGEKTREIFNTLGQKIRLEQFNSSTEKWLVMSDISYDSRGRETIIIDYDYRPDGKELLKQNRDLTYDATGALTQIKWGHGTIETFSEDLALRQSTHTTNTGGSTTKVILTTSDQPDGAIKKERMVYINDQENSRHTAIFDVLGRLITESSTGELDKTYTYDSFGRVTRQSVGKKTSTYKYPDNTPGEQVTALSIVLTGMEFPLGTQTFDGLGRITQTKIGGRETKYTYTDKNPWPKATPERKTSPPGYGSIELSSKYDDKARSLAEKSTGSIDGKTNVLARTMSHTYSFRGLLLKSVDGFNNETQFEYDNQGRLIAARNAIIQHTFNFNGNGLLASETLTHIPLKRSIITEYSYDKMNREIKRSFKASGFDTLTLEQQYTYTNSPQISEIWLTQNGKSIRDESYTYNNLGQLSNYQANGSHLAITKSGVTVQAQTFEYDEFGNSTTRFLDVQDSYVEEDGEKYSRRYSVEEGNIHDSKLDWTQASASYTYNPVGNSQEIAIEHDEYGFRKKIDGHELEYNQHGQLAKSNYNYRYVYDSNGSVAGCHGDSYTEQFHYKGDYQYARTGSFIRNKIKYQRDSILLNSSHACVMLQQVLTPEGKPNETTYSFELKDTKGSVIASYDLSKNVPTFFAYTPFGYRPNDIFQRSWIGFNGEPMDRTSEYYHLGNGVRVYDPVNQYFLSPDSYSPFGSGGLNSRSYCNNDPVNYSDPSGHVPGANIYETVYTPYIADPLFLPVVWGAIGIALAPLTGGSSIAVAVTATGFAVASAAFGIASAALRESNPELSESLGYASLATGLASAGAGALGSTAVRAGASAARSVEVASSRLVVMGGKMRSVSQVDGELYTFVDTYKKMDRLNIAVHGKDLSILERIGNKSSSVILNNMEHTASDLLSLLKAKNLDPSKYDNIRLLICYSGNGGSSSFSAQFAQLVQRPVKGFIGPVTMKYGSSTMLKIFKEYNTAYGVQGAQEVTNLFETTITHSVLKHNPYKLISDPIKHANFRYSPVYF